MSSLHKTVTRQRRGCDLNPGPSAPESSTLTSWLPSHPQSHSIVNFNESVLSLVPRGSLHDASRSCSSGACRYRLTSGSAGAPAAAELLLLLRSGAGGRHDRKAAAVDGIDRRTDGHPHRYVDPAPHSMLAASIKYHICLNFGI